MGQGDQGLSDPDSFMLVAMRQRLMLVGSGLFSLIGSVVMILALADESSVFNSHRVQELGTISLWLGIALLVIYYVATSSTNGGKDKHER